jgi:hypothetical protein
MRDYKFQILSLFSKNTDQLNVAHFLFFELTSFFLFFNPVTTAALKCFKQKTLEINNNNIKLKPSV